MSNVFATILAPCAAALTLSSATCLAADQDEALRNVSFVEVIEGKKVAAVSVGRLELRRVPAGPLRLGVVSTAMLENVRIEVFRDRIPALEWRTQWASSPDRPVRLEIVGGRAASSGLRREERDLYDAIRAARDRLLRETMSRQEIVGVTIKNLSAFLYVRSEPWASLACAVGNTSGRRHVFDCHTARLTSRGRREELEAPLIRFGSEREPSGKTRRGARHGDS